MKQLEKEMLSNLKDTLAELHGAKSCDTRAYDNAIHKGYSPEGAWSVFRGTLREIDVGQEMEDVESLLNA